MTTFGDALGEIIAGLSQYEASARAALAGVEPDSVTAGFLGPPADDAVELKRLLSAWQKRHISRCYMMPAVKD